LPSHAPLELVRLDRGWPAVGHGGENSGYVSTAQSPPGAAAAPIAAPFTARRADTGPARESRGDRASALQVHNRYLIAESDEGLVVIDQHALHERILYELLREKVLAGALESQALLVPEPVDLSPAEAAAVLESQDVLAQLGVTITPFGGGTVLVSSYPAMLANVAPAEVLRDLVDKLLSGGKSPDRRDLLDELLHMISCKAAIKAGDRLTGDEIAALLAQRHLAQDAHHCPHGRPTALVFTREELDRQFKRT
jgi:DNA mismatch repair protein MutL